MLISAIIIVVSGTLFLAWLLLFRRKAEMTGKKQQPTAASAVHYCPVCGSGLLRGERVISEAYSYEESKIMYLRGCPECYTPGSRIKRRCPVCKQQLGRDDYLIGRMWQETRKKRLHVAGCTRCTKYPPLPLTKR